MSTIARWMRRLDRQSLLLVATIVIVLGCTVVLRGGYAAHPTLAGQLPPAGTGTRAPYRLVVVLGPRDCEAGLGFIHLASQPRFRGSLSVTGVLVGSREETRVAQQRLRARGYEFPLHARRSGPRAAADLGYPSTPYLLLMDEAGRVRLAADVPAAAAEMRSIEAAIRSIVLLPSR